MRIVKVNPLMFLLVFILIPINSFSDVIPAEFLFSEPQRQEVRLSPDGTRISYIAYNKTKIKNIFIKTIGKNDDRELIPLLESDIITHQWSYLPDQVLFFKSSDDRRAVHLYSIDINTNIIRDLTPFAGINAKFLITDHRRSEEIVCGIELKKRGRFDLYTINLQSGAISELAMLPEGTIDVKGDLLNKIIIAESVDRKTLKRTLKIKPSGGEKFSDLISLDIPDEFEIAGFSEDGKLIFALSNLNSNFKRFVRFDIETKRETETIASSDKSDINDIFFNPFTKRLIWVAYDQMRREISLIDKDYTEDLKAIEREKKGTISIISTDIKDEKWLFTLEQADTPPSYYIYNRKDRKTALLFLSHPELAKYRSIKSQPFNIKFKEKERLLLFVTLPEEQSSENFPLIINIVNKENSKRGVYFDPVCQFFSSRGFACITYNQSGIRGAGREYYDRAYSKEGLKTIEEEITTIIKWAIDRNIANQQQITIITDGLNAIPTLNVAVNNSDLIHTLIFLEPLFDIKYLRENYEDNMFYRLKDRLFIQPVDYKNIDSQLNKLTMPSFFFIDKSSKEYRAEEIIKSLLKAKNNNKDLKLFIYPDGSQNSVIDFFTQVESILSRYYNTDYAERRGDKKVDVEIR